MPDLLEEAGTSRIGLEDDVILALQGDETRARNGRRHCGLPIAPAR